MKKILTLLIMAVMCVLCITGCQNKKDDNTFICGVTIYEKMNEKDKNGNWTGFETEFAQEVAKIIGMNVEFQEIEWNLKYSELESGAIDCIWNGFTANSQDNGTPRNEIVDFSYGYMLNQQCVVIKNTNADTIKTQADLSGKKAGVEGGSAGHDYAKKFTDEDKIVTYTAQNKAFLELQSGEIDFAVVDIILAQNICGEGDYKDLMIVDQITLDSEIYAIGFKKGSELTAKVNDAIEELFANGKIEEIAKKYGLENSLQLNKEIKF